MLLESTFREYAFLFVPLTLSAQPSSALASVQATTGLATTQDVDMAEAPSESALPADVMTIIEETNSRLVVRTTGPSNVVNPSLAYL